LAPPRSEAIKVPFREAFALASGFSKARDPATGAPHPRRAAEKLGMSHPALKHENHAGTGSSPELDPRWPH